MDSPLLQPVKRKIVKGVHISEAHCVRFTIIRAEAQSVDGYFGEDKPDWQSFSAKDFREYAVLFTELADALDGGT